MTPELESGGYEKIINEEKHSTKKRNNKVETMMNKILQWAGHAWRNENPLICIILHGDSTGKRLLETPRMRCEYVVTKDMEALRRDLDLSTYLIISLRSDAFFLYYLV